MIKVESLSFAYNKNPIISNANLVIHPGISLIKGPNGSGKTTLAKILSGLLPPKKGYVYIDGINIYKRDKFSEEKLKEVVYVHDRPVILKGELYKSLIYGMKIMNKFDHKYMNDLIEYFDIEGILHKEKNEASAGEKQIVSIVRALLTKPRYLLLDEPFQYLDDYRRDQLSKYILQLKDKGVTLIIATHENIYRDKADLILTIKDSKIYI